MGDFRYLVDSLALELILVTDNVDEFARVPGLSIENWLAA
jgi:predicted nucleic acid-binding protein